jgi:hypothetical protein
MEHRANRGERQPRHLGPIGAAQEEHGHLDRVVPQAVQEAEADDDQGHERRVAQARGMAGLLEHPPREDQRQAHEEHRRQQE